jgi:hypothetical protein
MSIYVNRSLMSDEMTAEYERSNIRAMAMTICAHAGLEVSRYVSNGSREIVSLSTSSGLVPIVVHYRCGDSEYVVYGNSHAMKPNVIGDTELVTSKNLRYVMKAITSNKNCAGRFDSFVNTANNAINDVLANLRQHYIKANLPKQRDFYMDLTREQQDWAARLALGTAQAVGVPKEHLERIQSLCDFLEQREAVAAAYSNKTFDLFGCNKWVVGLKRNDVTPRNVIVGAIDGQVMVKKILGNDDETLYTVRPFRTYMTLNDIPDEIRAPLLSRLTLCNVAREGADASTDVNKLIPQFKYHAYEDVGAVAWRHSSDYYDDDAVQWFMCDM